jgi:hypothetical protein
MSTSARKTATPRKKATPRLAPPAPPQEAAGNKDPYAPTAWATFDREFVTPSGQRCRIKKLGLTELVESGLQDKLNTLQGVVNKKMGTAKGAPPKAVDPQALLKDKNTMSNFMGLVDDILVLTVTAPHIEYVPDNPGLRKPGVVYVDMVDLMDKVAIFNESVGGLQALAAFRQ